MRPIECLITAVLLGFFDGSSVPAIAYEPCTVGQAGFVGELLPNGECFALPSDVISKNHIALQHECTPKPQIGALIGTKCVPLNFNANPPSPNIPAAIEALSATEQDLHETLLLLERQIIELKEEIGAMKDRR